MGPELTIWCVFDTASCYRALMHVVCVYRCVSVFECVHKYRHTANLLLYFFLINVINQNFSHRDA